MGCCLSLSHDPQYATQATTEERHPDGVVAGATLAATASATAPAHTSGSNVGGPAASSNPRSRNRNRSHTHASTAIHPNFPLDEHFNAPIRHHIWHSKRRRWTRALLDQERKEFFETRVTGRPEVWTALCAALSFMRAGDLATAQSIIDAAGITVPTGDLCQGCYDEQGVLYRLPQCIVSDPENMVRPSGLTDDDEDDDDDDNDVDFETDDGKIALNEASGDELIADDDAVERERRRDEKGKTSERDLIRVKARLSDRGGPDIVVSVGKAQNVGFIARKVQQEAGVPRNQRVRIAYLGKILKEHTPLVDQGWKQGNVVNALVVTRHPLS